MRRAWACGWVVVALGCKGAGGVAEADVVDADADGVVDAGPATGPLASLIIEDVSSFDDAPNGVDVCGAQAWCGGDVYVLPTKVGAEIGTRRSGAFVGPSAAMDRGWPAFHEDGSDASFSVGLGGRLNLRFPRDLSGCQVQVYADERWARYGIYVCRGNAVDTSCMGGGRVALIVAQGELGG